MKIFSWDKGCHSFMKERCQWYVKSIYNIYPNINIFPKCRHPLIYIYDADRSNDDYNSIFRFQINDEKVCVVVVVGID